MPPDVKICGLKTAAAVAAAVSGGARLVGFVFFPPSPRGIAPSEAAALSAQVAPGVTRVGLFVDADDAFMDAVLAEVCLDMLQFHGDEPAERVLEARRRHRLPVMKAIGITGPKDLETARAYEGAADRLLFDAKPPPGASRPGGNARAFDWGLLGGQTWRLPWMLAGGLDAANVAEAVRVSGAAAVDVSSGVEDGPGVKNLKKIGEFLEAISGI